MPIYLITKDWEIFQSIINQKTASGRSQAGMRPPKNFSRINTTLNGGYRISHPNSISIFLENITMAQATVNLIINENILDRELE